LCQAHDDEPPLYCGVRRQGAAVHGYICELLPVGKAGKRVQNGAEDSVYVYAKVMLSPPDPSWNGP
jgi:hypothetical protein